MIISDACTINITNDAPKSVNDAYRSISDDSRVMLYIVASLYDRHDDRNVFIVVAPDQDF